MNDGEGFEAAGYMREYARGNVDKDPDVHLHTGLVRDARARAWLTWMAERYQPITDGMPASFWETEFAQKAIRKYGTETAQQAVEEGQMHVIDYLTGMPDAKTDISVMDTIDWLHDWLGRDAATTVVSGHMNSGKTNTALLFGEIWKRVFTNGEVASNIRTCPETTSISQMDTLVEWAFDQPEKPKLFIFDEAASYASSDLDDHETKEQMRGFIRLMAKLNIYMIVIGHARGGSDLNTEFRRFGHAVEKEGKKRAVIYEKVSEGREYENQLKELTGIPPTSWDYDPDEPSSWKWNYEGEDLHNRVREEVAGLEIDGYEDEVFDDEELEVMDEDEPEEEYVCGSTDTSDGEPCQMKVTEPDENCRHHR